MGNNKIQKIDRQRWVKFFTHFIVISILFILPELMFSYTRPHMSSVRIFSLYFKAALYVGIFYLDYYVIIGRTLLGRRHRVLWFLLLNLAIIIVALILINLMNKYVLGLEGWQPRHEMARSTIWLRWGSMVLRDAGIMALTIALSVALRLGESWSDIEKRHQTMMASQKEDELQSLKSQLNPHFLFNTLNTIYALIEVSPKEAQEAVHELSSLLRYVLYENPEKVQFSQEINFAKNYISLMQMRLGNDAVKAEFDDASNGEAMVAPLLFITLIENAFKHGNTGNKSHPIVIGLTADAEGNMRCITSNHFITKSVEENRKSGIGLANLRRRLQLIYGDAAKLTTQLTGDVYTAILTIKNQQS